jgi:hypothetical protein
VIIWRGRKRNKHVPKIKSKRMKEVPLNLNKVQRRGEYKIEKKKMEKAIQYLTENKELK